MAVAPKKTKMDVTPMEVDNDNDVPVEIKLSSTTLSLPFQVGTVYMFGQGDIGQLGIEAEKRKFPALVPDLPKGGTEIKQVCCGGTHTVVLTKNGKVYTYGNNDDLALGRVTEEEEDMRCPGQVELDEVVVQVSAGDSHSAALTDQGIVFVWGNFRDANGNMGLVPGKGNVSIWKPQRLSFHENLFVKIVKIVSGVNHLVMLGDDGYVYTCGSGEQGQLGRTKPMRKLRSSLWYDNNDFYLTPMKIKGSAYGSKKAIDIWAGEYSTYCKAGRGGDIWVCGLNNCGQLGVDVGEDDKNLVVPQPIKSPGFIGRKWIQIAAGGHHALALDEEGKTYALGRPDDGRLGLGEDCKEPVSKATPIPRLENQKIVQICCGLSTSYAVNDKGEMFSWGFGDNWQLATGSSEDEFEPTPCKFSINDSSLTGVSCVSAGGQHAGIVRSTAPVKVVSLPKNNKQPTIKKAAIKRPAVNHIDSLNEQADVAVPSEPKPGRRANKAEVSTKPPPAKRKTAAPTKSVSKKVKNVP